MTTTNPENINKTVVYIQPITHHKHDLLNLLCLTLVLPDRYPRASLRESERERVTNAVIVVHFCPTTHFAELQINFFL